MIFIELWICKFFLQLSMHHCDFLNAFLCALQLVASRNSLLASGLLDFELFRGFLRRSSAKKKIAIGRKILLLGFGLYFLRNFAQILGENGQLPEIWAAWIPPVAAIGLSLAFLLHTEDG